MADPARVSFFLSRRDFQGGHILGSVGAVVHEEKLDILGVLHKEGLVARGHHMTGLLVAAVADLSIQYQYSVFLFLHGRKSTYGGHGNVAPEASTDAVVDTLGLAP